MIPACLFSIVCWTVSGTAEHPTRSRVPRMRAKMLLVFIAESKGCKKSPDDPGNRGGYRSHNVLQGGLDFLLDFFTGGDYFLLGFFNNGLSSIANGTCNDLPGLDDAIEFRHGTLQIFPHLNLSRRGLLGFERFQRTTSESKCSKYNSGNACLLSELHLILLQCCSGVASK